jgi:peptide/nickel transport system ATP-binding protein
VSSTSPDASASPPAVSPDATAPDTPDVPVSPGAGSANGHTLEVDNLKMYFPVTKGILRRKIADIKAVDGVSFAIGRGETLGLVGESGCGKTTVGRCVIRLYEPTAGSILFEGQDIAKLPESKLRPLRRRVAVVLQDPASSLDPRQSIGKIVEEPLRTHHLAGNKARRRERIAELFEMVGLDPRLMERYPHELSGGQRQRVAIARSLAGDPSLIICDEPVSALDVSIQAQIINLLSELQEKLKDLTYMFISHDLWLVHYLSTRVAVMYMGRIVEMARADQLYDEPLHPYSQALLSAVPTANPVFERQRKPIVLEGETPSLLHRPIGCHFHPRCPLATRECREVEPALRTITDGHLAACIKV